MSNPNQNVSLMLYSTLQQQVSTLQDEICIQQQQLQHSEGIIAQIQSECQEQVLKIEITAAARISSLEFQLAERNSQLEQRQYAIDQLTWAVQSKKDMLIEKQLEVEEMKQRCKAKDDELREEQESCNRRIAELQRSHEVAEDSWNQNRQEDVKEDRDIRQGLRRSRDEHIQSLNIELEARRQKTLEQHRQLLNFRGRIGQLERAEQYETSPNLVMRKNEIMALRREVATLNHKISEIQGTGLQGPDHALEGVDMLGMPLMEMERLEI